MKAVQTKSVLVVSSNGLPKNKKWWQGIDQVVGPSMLKERVQKRGLSFIDIATLMDAGNVRQSFDLLNKLSRLTLSSGSRLSRIVNYKGYELWWMHYGDICHKFCFPYTQRHGLLEYLNDFDKVYFYRADCTELLNYFLKAHGRRCIVLTDWRGRLRKWLPPAGILVQLILSAVFLLPIIIIRPSVIYRTGDRTDPPLFSDFRHRKMYEELWKRRISFVEFIRSTQSWYMVLRNAWRRKRPVIYSTAITDFILDKLNLFEKKEDKNLINLACSDGKTPEETFWLFCATHYLRGKIRATRWSIKVMQLILQMTGARAAIFIAMSSRNMSEVLGCKLAGIKTLGIQSGLAFRYYYYPHDFTPEYDGVKSLSLDRFGLWSEWWKEYYLSFGKAYKKEQLAISGPMRPLEKDSTRVVTSAKAAASQGSLRVLLISEEFATPKAAMPYLLALLGAADFALSLKARPQFDSFADYLKKNEPGISEKLSIVKEDINQAISQADVIVGSHSTAVLEGLCQLKPFVAFRTDEWDDYFEIKDLDEKASFFAENPQELVEKVRKSVDVPEEDLRKLQTRFFGDPYQNGAKWVVDQIEEFLNKPKEHGYQQ